MTTKDEVRSTVEALKLALEALEKIGLRDWVERKEAAITAIREALAEQQLSELCRCGKQTMAWCMANTCSKAEQPAPATELRKQQDPNYSICPTCGGMASDPIVPPSDRLTSKPWVGLTAGEIHRALDEAKHCPTDLDIAVAEIIEAKLKEKNGF